MLAKQMSLQQPKRLNPFKGLVIDVDTWEYAHKYHRDQQRMHALSMHGCGVVTGLEVIPWNPPDNSVVVCPGIAISPDGSPIVVSEPQRFYLDVDSGGMARITLEYSEVGQDTMEVPGEGRTHPLHLLECFRIREQRGHALEPQVELARVDIGEGRFIQEASDPSWPQANQIDMRFRPISGRKPEGEIFVGLLAYPRGQPVEGWQTHRRGIFNLVQSIQRSTSLAASMLDVVHWDDIKRCQLLFMTGRREFQLSDTDEAAISNDLLKRVGVLFAEACSCEGGPAAAVGFRTAFARLCERLGRRLQPLGRDHPLMGIHHIFGAVPMGQNDTALAMENDGVIYSDSDYASVWEGGNRASSYPRSMIRDAIDFGTNIALYSWRRAAMRALQQQTVARE